MEQPAPQPQQPEPVSVADSGLPMRRSAENRVIGGVCGGLAEHTDIDPIIYRVLTVVLAIIGGAGLILYGAAMLLIPDPHTGTAPLGKLFSGGRGRSMRAAGVVLAIVCLLVVTGGLFDVFGGGSLSIVVIAGLAALVAHRRGANFKNLLRGATDGAPEPATQAVADKAATDQAATDQARPSVTPKASPTTTAWTPQPPPVHPRTQPFTAPPQATPTPTPTPAGPTAPGSTGYFDFASLGTAQPTARSGGKPQQQCQVRSITFPVIAVAAGVGGLVAWLQHLGEIAGDVRVPLAAALGTLGLGLVVSAWVGRARVKGWGVLLTLALGAATVLVGPNHQVHWAPASTSSLAAAQPYHVGVGVAKLDLTDLPMRAGRTYPAEVTADAGQLVVVVPRSAAVDITADCEQCVVEAFGEQLASGKARIERHLPASSSARSGSPDRSAEPVVALDLTFEFGHVEVRRAA